MNLNMKIIWKPVLIPKINFIRDQRGLAAMLVVIVIAASVLLMAYNISALGLSESGMGFSSQKGDHALSLAESCGEEVLRRLRLDNDYKANAGDFQLPIGANYCIINITKTLNQRTILVSGVADNFYRKIEIIVNISGTNNDVINLASWQEKEN